MAGGRQSERGDAIAKTEAYAVSCRERKKGRDALRSSEAHTQARSIAPPRPKWSQRRVPFGRQCPKPEETGEAHPPSDAGLRHIRQRAQIGRPDPRRNRYPLSSAEWVL
jgi:hypothetical protein